METQTRLSRHNKFISVGNITPQHSLNIFATTSQKNSSCCGNTLSGKEKIPCSAFRKKVWLVVFYSISTIVDY